MALRDQPYFPLYVQDYLTDEKLNMCSASAQGIYIKLLCLMHKSEDYGKILFKQRYKQNESMIKNFAVLICKQLPFDLSIVESALEELIAEDVIQIDGSKLLQKRMVKDGETSLKRSAAGKKGGGNPVLFKHPSKQRDKQADKQNTEYENEYENESEYENKNEKEKNSLSLLKNKEKEKEADKEKKEIKVKAIPRKKYGEYKHVFLTEEEYERFVNDFGLPDAREAIRLLDEYIELKGAKYRNHNLALRKWPIKQIREDRGETFLEKSIRIKRQLGVIS